VSNRFPWASEQVIKNVDCLYTMNRWLSKLSIHPRNDHLDLISWLGVCFRNDPWLQGGSWGDERRIEKELNWKQLLMLLDSPASYWMMLQGRIMHSLCVISLIVLIFILVMVLAGFLEISHDICSMTFNVMEPIGRGASIRYPSIWFGACHKEWYYACD